MDLNDIDESLREATLKLGNVPVMPEAVLRLMPLAMRLVPTRRTDGVELSVIKHGRMKLRLHRPAEPNGAALLWIHGGGYITESAAQDDVFCGKLAHRTGITVVAVDYRLSPGARFPKPLEDCYDGWRWLREHVAELGLDPVRLAVGGQSAGGGLAAALVQRLHDEGDDPAAQWLFCPMLDDRTATNRALDTQTFLVWDNRANLMGWKAYLGPQVGGPTLPAYASAARRDDLSGLPPTWIYAGDRELFYAEDRRYADRLEAAGVDTTFVTVTGTAHGFENWAADNPKAIELVTQAGDWLAATLG